VDRIQQKVENSDTSGDKLNDKWVRTKLQNEAKNPPTFAGSALTPSPYPITIFAKLLDVDVCSRMRHWFFCSEDHEKR
jgi:hypothetical protein